MFNVEFSGYSWSKTTSGRGKRVSEVKSGLWIVEHISTGKFIIGSCGNVSKEVDKQIELLIAGKHPNKKLTKLFEIDPDLKLYEVPMDGKAKVLEREIRANTTPQYLLLN